MLLYLRIYYVRCFPFYFKRKYKIFAVLSVILFIGSIMLLHLPIYLNYIRCYLFNLKINYGIFAVLLVILFIGSIMLLYLPIYYIFPHHRLIEQTRLIKEATALYISVLYVFIVYFSLHRKFSMTKKKCHQRILRNSMRIFPSDRYR